MDSQTSSTTISLVGENSGDLSMRLSNVTDETKNIITHILPPSTNFNPAVFLMLSDSSVNKASSYCLPEEKFLKISKLWKKSKQTHPEYFQELVQRKCEDKIYELKDTFNGLSIEIRKIIQETEELRESEARARIQKIIINDDDDDLGFYAGNIDTTPETETDYVEDRCGVSNPRSHEIDFAHLATDFGRKYTHTFKRSYVDDDDTDDDDDYDDDITAFSLSPPIPISPIFCPSSTIPVVDLDLPLEEADVPSFSDDSILRGIESDRDSGEDTTSIDALPLDDSMILLEYESFTFDDEPVMAEVNIFDEINTSELSYPGIGENVLDEEEDTFTFTTRSFLPFVTYPEVLPTSYSTGSEDKVFKPGIFDNVLTRKSSLKIFDPPSCFFPNFGKIPWFNIVEEQSMPGNIP
ncbi:hypothetical protein Tco_0628892 [Tanacetum coccineum]|uniref:Uncharacterized protein n=1 Tax=Tanacetum coccineum TaxID=301880 RepID=A0ABQ4WRM5_9ASTR